MTSSNRPAEHRLEAALLLLIAIVCAGLAFLQYRWTGELSRAEHSRLRAGLGDQAARLSRAFDEEWSEQCRALLPSASDLQDGGVERSHGSLHALWITRNEPYLFDRIGIAVPEAGDVRLYGLDREGGRVTKMDWPTEWLYLRRSMQDRAAGKGPPPRINPQSNSVEFVVFERGNRAALAPRGGPRELEWMIFDLSEYYLVNWILPPLVKTHINSQNEVVYDVSVSPAHLPREVLFSTLGPNASVSDGAELTVGLFSTAPTNGRDRRRQLDREPTAYRWNLSIRHRGGSLEAAVARSRAINLLMSLALIAVLGGTAFALVRYTAYSRRLAEMQMRFAAGISHDLRTPLSAIRGAAFNLAGDVVTDHGAVKRYASLILRNSEQLTGMIENVLAYSALQSKAPAHREQVAVDDLVRRVAAAMASHIESAGCHLEQDVAEGLPAVNADPAALEAALRNLLDNALQHARPGRWIGLSARHASDGGVVIQVSDRGKGIPEPELQNVFEPFFRGDRARSGNIRGTGLGLSLAKEAVEKHGGTISVSNSPSGGAVFVIQLPGPDQLP